MKYSININQKILVELVPDVTLDEAAILDYLRLICTTPSEAIESQRKMRDGKKYTWVDYDHLLSEMPLLRGTTRASTSQKIKQIEDWGFITSFLGQGSRKYVTLLPKIDLLYLDSALSRFNASIKHAKGQHKADLMYNNTNISILNNNVAHSSQNISSPDDSFFKAVEDNETPPPKKQLRAEIIKFCSWYDQEAKKRMGTEKDNLVSYVPSGALFLMRKTKNGKSLWDELGEKKAKDIAEEYLWSKKFVEHPNITACFSQDSLNKYFGMH